MKTLFELENIWQEQLPGAKITLNLNAPSAMVRRFQNDDTDLEAQRTIARIDGFKGDDTEMRIGYMFRNWLVYQWNQTLKEFEQDPFFWIPSTPGTPPETTSASSNPPPQK